MSLNFYRVVFYQREDRYTVVLIFLSYLSCQIKWSLKLVKTRVALLDKVLRSGWPFFTQLQHTAISFCTHGSGMVCASKNEIKYKRA